MTDKLTPEEFIDLRNKFKGFDDIETKLETVKDRAKCLKIINTLEERKIITLNKAKALRSYVTNGFKVKVDPFQRLIKQLQKSPNHNDSSIYLALDIAKQKLARKSETIVNLNSLITKKQKILAKHKIVQRKLQDEHDRLTKQAELFETILKSIPAERPVPKPWGSRGALPPDDDDEDIDDDDVSDSDDDDVGDVVVEEPIRPFGLKKTLPPKTAVPSQQPVTEAE